MRYVNSVSNLPTCDLQNVDMILSPGKAGQSPVAYYASRSIQKGEELLVDYGEAYFKNMPKLLARVRYECKMSPLHLASARGNVDTARALLVGSSPVDINQARDLLLDPTHV